MTAFLFKNSKTGEYVLAFKGTSTNKDIAADIIQGLSIPSQMYDDAVDLAKTMKEKYGNKLILTGHSLGGALAAAAAVSNVIPAVTFNSAGLSPTSLERYGASQKLLYKLVDAYRVEDELLSGFTNGIDINSANVGHTYLLPRNSQGIFDTSIKLHGIDQVIESLFLKLHIVSNANIK